MEKRTEKGGAGGEGGVQEGRGVQEEVQEEVQEGRGLQEGGLQRILTVCQCGDQLLIGIPQLGHNLHRGEIRLVSLAQGWLFHGA